MRVARIMRRTVAVGAISTVLGIGMAVTATPAHAMRQECRVAEQNAYHWWDLYNETKSTNLPLALHYLAVGDAFWSNYESMNC